MKHIFYFIGIAFVIYEMIWLLNPKDQVEKAKEMKEEGKKNKGKKWDDYTDKYKSLLKTKGLASLTFTLWMFCGLLTFNWLAFLLKIAFNFIVIAPISKLTQYSWAYTGLHWFNSLLGFAFGLFVIVNSYHLKIDIYAWFLGLL
jgi:hypothetical protein